MKHFNINKNFFLKWFLTPLKIISEQCIININPSEIYSIVTMDSNMILSNKISGNFDIVTKLNIHDIKTFIKLLDCIKSEYLLLNINDNDSCIEYKSPTFSFKHHLVVDDVMTKVTVTKERIDDFKYDIQFDVPFSKIHELMKCDIYGSDSSGITKAYLYVNKNNIFIELTDKSQCDVNVISCLITNEYDGEILNVPLSFDLNILKMIELNKKSNGIIRFRINNEFKVLNLYIIDNIDDSGNIRELQYIIPTFIK